MIMNSSARISKQLFKTQTVLLSTMPLSPVLCHIRPATSVAAQLRTVRHHIVRFPVALALNTDAPLRPALPAPSNPCLLRPNSISRSSWPERQLAEKSSSGPQEPLNQSGCACSLDYSAERPAASHPKDADSKLVSVSSEFINSYS